MDSPSRRRVRRICATPRGVSLIEGMIASVVLLIGLMGVFQGIVVASRQNTLANRATRASGIASQVRGALDTMGRARVVGAGGLLTGAACNPTSDVRALTGGLENLSPASGEAWAVRCIFDLDASERNATPANRLLPGYTSDDFGSYRRVLVVIEKPDEKTQVAIHQVIIVVSWMEMVQRRYVRQYVSFYDAGSFGNGTNIEI